MRNFKKVYLKNFGCQMNVRDSEVICGLLEKEGFSLSDESNKADIILFNTCAVRQHAEDKVWSEIGRYKKGQSPPLRGQVSGAVPIIGIVGCMAQEYKEKIFERAPQVDFVVGPSDIHKIPAILKKLSANKLYETKIWETDGSIRPAEIYHTGFYEDKNHTYVVISEGCVNYCSYCVVPYVRGELRNRDYKDILKYTDIDGVIISTPTATHFKIAKDFTNRNIINRKIKFLKSMKKRLDYLKSQIEKLTNLPT